MTRRTLALLWAALLVTPPAFLAVAMAALAGAAAPAPALAEPLFWAAAGATAVNLLLSRVVPPRCPAPAGGSWEAAAFGRQLVGFALCDAAALGPVVAWLVTRDARLLGLVAVALFALVLLYPTDARWESVRHDLAGGPAPRRAVR